MARSNFEDGDVFEIFLSKRRFAYCRVIGRNQYSPLFELFKEVLTTPNELSELNVTKLARERVLYINKFSLKNKKKARFLGNVSLSKKSKKHPPIFREVGIPSRWRLDWEDRFKLLPFGTRYIDLVEKGYVQMTIFPTEAIVAFFVKGEPLLFPPDVEKDKFRQARL